MHPHPVPASTLGHLCLMPFAHCLSNVGPAVVYDGFLLVRQMDNSVRFHFPGTSACTIAPHSGVEVDTGAVHWCVVRLPGGPP